MFTKVLNVALKPLKRKINIRLCTTTYTTQSILHQTHNTHTHMIIEVTNVHDNSTHHLMLNANTTETLAGLFLSLKSSTFSCGPVKE